MVGVRTASMVYASTRTICEALHADCLSWSLAHLQQMRQTTSYAKMLAASHMRPPHPRSHPFGWRSSAPVREERLEQQLTLEHNHSASADLDRFDGVAWADDLDIQRAGALHPMTLFGHKCRLIDQAIVP